MTVRNLSSIRALTKCFPTLFRADGIFHRRMAVVCSAVILLMMCAVMYRSSYDPAYSDTSSSHCNPSTKSCLLYLSLSYSIPMASPINLELGNNASLYVLQRAPLVHVLHRTGSLAKGDSVYRGSSSRICPAF